MSNAIDMDPAAARSFDIGRPVRLGLVAIALTFGGLGGWAALASLDSASIASGQLAVETDRKPIQHLQGGVVAEILVKESDHVAEGQVLFRLEAVQAQADLDRDTALLDAATAFRLRLTAERNGRTELKFPLDFLQAVNKRGHASIISDQRRQFREKRQALANDLQLQQVRITQAEGDIEARKGQAQALQDQIDSYGKESASVAPLVAKGIYPRNKQLELDRNLARVTGDLKSVSADIARSQGTIGEARIQITQLQQKYTEEATQQLTDLRSKIQDLEQRITVANDVLAHVEIRAPKAGIVQNIKVHANGAVIRAGDTIADLVTPSDGLIVTARVMPSDIHNVAVGQRTEIRFPSMAHDQKKPAYGRLDTLSADLVSDDATHQAYYAARVTLDTGTVEPALAQRLVPGMPADILIVNGEHTVLSYLFDPIFSRLAKSLRDR